MEAESPRSGFIPAWSSEGPLSGYRLFFFLIFLLYNIVSVLPYINMNLHGCTQVPNPETPSHLPPHTIPLGHPSAPAPSILYPASNLDW